VPKDIVLSLKEAAAKQLIAKQQKICVRLKNVRALKQMFCAIYVVI